MPDYYYKATDNTGAVSSGIRFANNPQDLTTVLRQTGLRVLEVHETSGVNIFRKLAEIQLGGISRRDLVEFSNNMGVMLRAGVNLVNALIEIKQDHENAYLKKVVGGLIEDLQAGSGLHEAMAKYPKVFPALYVSVVAIGEATGNLDSVFFDLARHYKQIDTLIGNVRKAMIYPAFVLLAMLGASFVFLGVVFPPLFEILVEFDVELPTITLVVMAVSETIQNYWHLIIGGLVLFAVLFVLARKNPTTRYPLDWLELRTPGLKTLMTQLRMTFFMRYMAMLLSSGVLILRALEMSAASVPNLEVRNFLNHVRQRVIDGELFSASLRGSRYVPNMVVRMIAIGEESGNLPEQMEYVADRYNEELERKIAAALAMLEPILIVILAGFALSLVMGVMLPLYGLVSELSMEAGTGGGM